MTLKKSVPIALMLVAALGLTACGADGGTTTEPGESNGDALVINGETIASADLLAAAQAEGEIVLYDSYPEEQNRRILDVFTEDTGIEVDLIRAVTAQLYERAVAESGAGRGVADVFSINDITLMEDMAERGILAEYDSPMATEALEEDQYDPEQQWYTSSRVTLALAYNEQLVDEADVPMSWEDLLDPKWDGKIGMTPITVGGSAFSTYSLMRELHGDEYWEALAANNPRMYQSVVPLTQDLVRGEVPLAISGPTVVQSQRADGAPVNSVLFEEGTPSWANLVGIMEDANNPNAARLYVEWLLSERGQQTVSEIGGEFPARLDMSHSYEGAIAPSNGGNLIIPPIEAWEEDARNEVIREWEAVFLN